MIVIATQFEDAVRSRNRLIPYYETRFRIKKKKPPYRRPFTAGTIIAIKVNTTLSLRAISNHLVFNVMTDFLLRRSADSQMKVSNGYVPF